MKSDINLSKNCELQNKMETVVNHFKILLVGDSGVGKTTFINRHVTGEFTKKYEPTLGVEVNNLRFHTSDGDIIFEVWDIAGQNKFSGMRKSHYSGADGVIIMFDVTNRMSLGNISNWDKDTNKSEGTISKVLCGNKVDVSDRKIHARHITYHHGEGYEYYDISAKSNHNFEKPFLSLARKLLGNDKLMFEGPEKDIEFPCVSSTTFTEGILDEDEEAAIEQLYDLSDKSLKLLCYYMKIDWQDDQDMVEVIRDLMIDEKESINEICQLSKPSLRLLCDHMKIGWEDDQDMIKIIGETLSEEPRKQGCIAM